MLELKKVEIKCQSPSNENYIDRVFNSVNCTLAKDCKLYEKLYNKARDLAENVNSGAANNSELKRNAQRRLIDSFGGLIAEKGWETFINNNFDNIAKPTKFIQSNGQIDIELSNGHTCEIRSSFPRNGVKFAICNDRYNFRNIGPYSNSIKIGEIQKDFYLSVLFDTSKIKLLTDDEIKFTLVGGSTWSMMIKIGYNTDLVPEDDSFAGKSNYRVIDLKNVLDAEGILNKIRKLDY